MFEHVGAARLDEYFAALLRAWCVPVAGCSTTASRARLATAAAPASCAAGFIDRYVFPDGELHEIGSVVSRIQHAGFEARHVEGLREHYALTLRAWVRNLEAAWPRSRRRGRCGTRPRLAPLHGRVGGELRSRAHPDPPGARGARRPRRERLPLRPDWEPSRTTVPGQLSRPARDNHEPRREATGLVYEDRVGVDPSVFRSYRSRVRVLRGLESAYRARFTAPRSAPFTRSVTRARAVLARRVSRSRDARPARMADDAHHLPRSRRLSRADPARFGAVRSVVHARRTSGRGSRSRATTGSTSPRSTSPDYLYISHLHRDHFDPEWLARHVDKRRPGAAPGVRRRSPRRGSCDALGFHDFVRTKHGEPLDLDGLARHDPRDDLARRRSARRLRDRARRRLGPGAQPERRPARRSRRAPRARPVRRAAAPVLGRDLVPDRLRLPRRGEGAARARQAHRRDGRARSATSRRSTPPTCFPCAGPPCFLDADLFALNDLDRDPANIFPDQTGVPRPARARTASTAAHLIVPGSVVELDGGECTVTHPDATTPTRPRRSPTSARTSSSTSATGPAGSTRERAAWARPGHDLVAELAAWFEPLLERAPITSAGVAGNVVLDVGDPDANVCIDFVESEVRVWRGEPYVYKVDVDRALDRDARRRPRRGLGQLAVPLVPVHRAPRRPVQRVRDDVLQGALARAHRLRRAVPPRPRARRTDEFFERDGWRIERWCPHRQADLTRFGEIADGVLTCSLHHWRFDLETGRCLTSDDRHLRCERVTPD